MASKVWSDEYFNFYKREICKILNKNNDGEWHPTHSFQSNFFSKDQLRKTLRTLLHMEILEWKNEGMNYHKWRITENGKKFINDSGNYTQLHA